MNKVKMDFDKKCAIKLKDVLEENHADLALAPTFVNHANYFTGNSIDISSSKKFNSKSMDADNKDVDFDYVNYDYMDDSDDYIEDEDSDGDIDDYGLSLDAQFNDKSLPPGVEATVPWLLMPSDSKPVASSSTFPFQPSSSKAFEKREDEILKKFIDFKHFDSVTDYSDHNFKTSNKSSKVGQFLSAIIKPSKDSSEGSSLPNTKKNWSKKIQEEWKILENNLPDGIFVRAYEERMDLMRAVIVGSVGTPYHDGLFFFDLFFPSDYPAQPPSVYYHSGGLRLNPNLYATGKVCLSLLNTWTGTRNEKWCPQKSTVLQVLVSIQGLVLNAKPYFNEPAFGCLAGKPEGERKAIAYNEITFLLSCKTMLYTLQRPPKHFEDFVVGHFHLHAHSILEACKAYMDGAQVGFPDGVTKESVHERLVSSSKDFKDKLGQMFPKLLEAFTDNGADCRKFLPEKTVTAAKK